MPDEVIIVGSGAAGVAAALALIDKGLRPTILDVGLDPPPNAPLHNNFYEVQRREDLFDVMIGQDFDRVRAHARAAYPLPAKLTAPRIQFITQDAERLQPMAERDFAVVRSFATGGLANAWGAGLYRATDHDMAGFPLRCSELSPYYDRLTAEIGISGESDDLDPFFGSTTGLQPALRPSRKAAWLLGRYRRRKTRLNAAGFFLGRPRLGVLSQPHADRGPCDYSNLEFWEPNLPFLYTPRWTLNRLVRENRVCHRKGLLVEAWSNEGGHLVIRARELATGAPVSFSTRFLVLAAGAIGSGRLALASRRDHQSKLCLLDNAARQFPLILPWFIGSTIETECFGLTQLNLVYQTSERASPWQASILEITSPAKSEFFGSLPLAARDNLRLIRSLVPAMLVMQLFFPAGPEPAARLSLSPDGTLNIERRARSGRSNPGQTVHQGPAHDGGDHPLVLDRDANARAARNSLCGHVAHVGNGRRPLPMRPLLSPARRSNVYVADGSVFPRLPAKNSSFMMMANAMRVANHLAEGVRSNT